jgi:NhaA family Na+:H+ antiporter
MDNEMRLSSPVPGFRGDHLLFIKNKKAALPANTNWKIFISANFLAGIGFTMSMFIATLAFSSSLLQDQAKVAVLCASLVAAILGSLFLASNKP